MVMCAVSGCRSNNDKRLKRNKVKGEREKVRFHRFPREEVFRKIWLARCDKHENYKVKNAYVCSKHFRLEQYACDLHDDIISSLSKNAIKLKPNALPAENLPWKGNYSLFHEEVLEINLSDEKMDAVVPGSVGDDISQLDLIPESCPFEEPLTYSEEQGVFFAVLENCSCTYDPMQGFENASENCDLIDGDDEAFMISNSYLDRYIY